MKKIFYLLFATIILASCTPKEEGIKVTVENPSAFDRISEMVEIPVNDISAKLALPQDSVYIVKDANGEIIPSQITYDNKLIFQSGLKANQSAEFIITTGSPREFKALTYGRFIQERKDDFAWENDRVAFRAYGPALIPIDGPSNGIDAWYKRTNELVVDKWYKNDLAGIASYHEDHGEGQDDYKVGRSLGAGAMAPYVNDKLWLNENYAEQEVLENGPLRTTFRLTYKNLDVDGKSVGETRTISLDAGSQLNKITQSYTISEPMKVAAGFVKREKNDSIVAGKDYIIYAEPESKVVDKVFMGIIFPEGMEKQIIDNYEITGNKNQKIAYSHVLGVTSAHQDKPVTYYAGFGWSKFGFDSISAFETYIRNFKEGLYKPLVVSIK
ncbi:MAG: DUF4861 domain-containing protein [Prevotella sp.]|nr:DUF4861 domain-containing protein [Prevotella sp.]